MIKEYESVFNPILNRGIQKIRKKAIVETTYDEFMSLLLKEELLKGHYYSFDFETKHTLGNTLNILHTGVTENICVYAISNSQIHNIAYSFDYPEDVLYYNPHMTGIGDYSLTNREGSWEEGEDNGDDVTILEVTATTIKLNEVPNICENFSLLVEDSNVSKELKSTDAGKYFKVIDNEDGSYTIQLFNINIDLTDAAYNLIEISYAPVLSTRKGWITYREDTLNKIKVTCDFRNVRIRYGKPDWTSREYVDTTPYSKKSLIYYDSSVYVSIVNSNTGNQPDISPDFWKPINDSIIITQHYATLRDAAYKAPPFTTEYTDYFILPKKGNYNIDIQHYEDSKEFSRSVLLNGGNNVKISNLKSCYFNYKLEDIILVEATDSEILRGFSNIDLASFNDNLVIDSMDNNKGKGEYNNNLVIKIMSNSNIFSSFSNNINLDTVQGNKFNIYTGNINLGILYRNQLQGTVVNNIFKDEVKFNTLNHYFYNNILIDKLILTDFKVNVTNVDFTGATIIYGDYNKEIIKDSSSNLKLIYLDDTNTIQYNLITD